MGGALGPRAEAVATGREPVRIEPPDTYGDSYLRHVRPVDDDPHGRPGGFLHADGNVRERTFSFLDGHPVTKGLAWCDAMQRFDPSHRFVDPLGFGSPSTGFRCAETVPPSPDLAGGH